MLEWNKFFEKNHKKLLIVCLIIFIFFSSFHLNDLFTADEYDFVNAGGAVVDTGRPVYYQGERNPEFNGTWHPPLFVGLVGLTFYVAGEGEVQLRTVTMIFAALTIFVVFYLTLELFRNDKNKYMIAVLACYIYALNPLTIQGGLMVDIDTGILMFAMSLYILAFLRWKDSLDLRKLMILSLAFGLLVWVKFGTPPVILFGIFLFYALNKQYKKAVGIPAVIGAIGFGVFVITWWLVANAKGLPFGMPFSHNSGTLGSMGFQQSDPGYIGYVIGGRLKLIVFWLTPFFIFFAQMSIRTRWKLFRKYKKVDGLDLVLIIALTIFIQYTLVISIAYYFPKYYAPFIPLTAVLIAYCICLTSYFESDSSNRNGNKILITYLVIAVITFVLMAILLGDPNMSRNNFGQSFDTLMGYIAMFFPALIILILLFKYYCKCTISFRKAFIVTLVICLGTSSLYINAVQMTADYSVRYNYGEEGMQEVIDYVRANTDTDSVIIAPKDIGYYVETRFYEAFGGWMEDWDELNNTIQTRNITHIVIRKEDAYSYKELPDEIIENILVHFDRIEKSSFGDFVVFERI